MGLIQLGKTYETTWERLVIETERAIKRLDDKLQNLFLILAAKKLKQLHSTKHHT